ncbi:MAG: pilus assembly protein PilP [Rhodocyclaceae bacterium]|nr:pilus assembly protein PilP [Rhodocyclaceae bacterium]
MTFAMALALAACSQGEPEDVRAWMQESAKDMKGKIPGVPEIKPLPVITFEPNDRAAPFSLDKLFAEAARARAASGSGPKPVNPDAYPFARVPLESIRLLGTMTIGNQPVAVVASDRDTPRQVRVGDYLGQNHGRIVSIRANTESNDGEIVIKEQVLEKGVWVERESRVTLPGQGEKK